jgi:hypothetical protein
MEQLQFFQHKAATLKLFKQMRTKRVRSVAPGGSIAYPGSSDDTRILVSAIVFGRTPEKNRS